MALLEKKAFKKIVCLIIMLTIVPIVVMLIFINIASASLSKNFAYNFAKNQSTVSVESIRQLLDGIDQNLTDLQHDKDIIKVFNKPEDLGLVYSRILDYIYSKYNDVNISILNRNGKSIIGESNKILERDREFGIIKALKNSDSIRYPRYYSNYNNGVAITIAKKIKNGNEVLGYILCDISYNTISGILSQREVTLPTYYFINDKYGGVAYIDLPINDDSLSFMPINELIEKSSLKYTKYVTYSENISDNLTLNTVVVYSSLVEGINYINQTLYIFLIISLIIILISSYYLYRISTKTEFKILENDMRIKELQTQLDSKFLFNALDVLQELVIISDYQSVLTVIEKMEPILKRKIHLSDRIIRFRDEMMIVDSYLFMCRLKYGDLLNYNIVVDNEIFDIAIPKLCVQPIVENAVLHGFDNKEKKELKIYISAFTSEDYLIIEIRNNGVSIHEDKLNRIMKNLQSNINKEDTEGLYNVNKRLKFYYGKQCGVTINNDVSGGVIVALKCGIVYYDELDKNIENE